MHPLTHPDTLSHIFFFILNDTSDSIFTRLSTLSSFALVNRLWAYESRRLLFHTLQISKNTNMSLLKSVLTASAYFSDVKQNQSVVYKESYGSYVRCFEAVMCDIQRDVLTIVANESPLMERVYLNSVRGVSKENLIEFVQTWEHSCQRLNIKPRLRDLTLADTYPFGKRVCYDNVIKAFLKFAGDSLKFVNIQPGDDISESEVDVIELFSEWNSNITEVRLFQPFMKHESVRKWSAEAEIQKLEIMGLNLDTDGWGQLFQPILQNCDSLSTFHVPGKWNDTTVLELLSIPAALKNNITAISAENASELPTYPNIKSLDLSFSYFTDAVFRIILLCCPNLESLDVCINPNLTSDILNIIADVEEYFSGTDRSFSLKRLNLYRCEQMKPNRVHEIVLTRWTNQHKPLKTLIMGDGFLVGRCVALSN